MAVSTIKMFVLVSFVCFMQRKGHRREETYHWDVSLKAHIREIWFWSDVDGKIASLKTNNDIYCNCLHNITVFCVTSSP